MSAEQANAKLNEEPIGKSDAIWDVTDAHVVFCSLGNYKTNYACFDLILLEIGCMVTYSNPRYQSLDKSSEQATAILCCWGIQPEWIASYSQYILIYLTQFKRRCWGLWWRFSICSYSQLSCFDVSSNETCDSFNTVELRLIFQRIVQSLCTKHVLLIERAFVLDKVNMSDSELWTPEISVAHVEM